MIDMYGGDYGLRDPGTFYMLCDAPFQTCFGEDLFPSIYDKAAKYVEGFATHQVFYDGNKRTAFGTMELFLRLNNLTIGVSQEDAYEFVMKIANDKAFDCGQIAAFIQENAIQYVGELELAEHEEPYNI